MKYFLSFNTSTGKFEAISHTDVGDKDVVLVLSTDTNKAVLYYTEGVGIVTQRTAQRMADSVTRSGFHHPKVGRIGENFELNIEEISAMNRVAQSQTTQPPVQSLARPEPKNDSDEIKETSNTPEIKEDIIQTGTKQVAENRPQSTSTRSTVDIDNIEFSYVDEMTSGDMTYDLTFKFVIYGPGIDYVKTVCIIANKEVPKKRINLHAGMDAISCGVLFDQNKVCYSLWYISTGDRFKEMRGMFFRGAVGALVYYDPKEQGSISDAQKTCNDMVREVPDIRIAVIRCGEGELEIDREVLPIDNIVGFYDLEGETDPYQQRIIAYLATLCMIER